MAGLSRDAWRAGSWHGAIRQGSADRQLRGAQLRDDVSKTTVCDPVSMV